MSLPLDVMNPGGSSILKKNSCGMEWEAEATLHLLTLELVVGCKPEFEDCVWFCETQIAILLSPATSATGQERGNLSREALVTFHSRNRSHLFEIPRSEMTSMQKTIEITFEIRSIVSHSSLQPRCTTGFAEVPLLCSDLKTSNSNTPRKRHVNSSELNMISNDEDRLEEGMLSHVEERNSQTAEASSSAYAVVDRRAVKPSKVEKLILPCESDPRSDPQVAAENSNVGGTTPSRQEERSAWTGEPPPSPSAADFHQAAMPSETEEYNRQSESDSDVAVEKSNVNTEVLVALEERVMQLEKTMAAAVEITKLEAAVLRDLKARTAQLEFNSTIAVENCDVEAAVLRELEARITRIENGANAKVKSSKIGRLWRASAGRLFNHERSLNPLTKGAAPSTTEKPPIERDYSKALAFKTFHPSKLEKSKTMFNGRDKKKFSMHDIFHEIELQPHMSLENVTHSFVKHFCTELYGGETATLLSQILCGNCAFPLVVEQITSAIISGYDFEGQLQDDDFMIKELRTILQKQLHKDFAELFSTWCCGKQVPRGAST